MINVKPRGLALAVFVGCSFFLCDLNKKVTVSTNMSDIAKTTRKLFGPLPKFQTQTAGKVFGYRAEFEQDNGVRTEFRAEKAIFMSIAGRQNKPFFEQNLSKPTIEYSSGEQFIH